MASTVFTYDHNPPKVSSPWPSLGSSKTCPIETTVAELRYDESAARLADYGVQGLRPEPQEGPVEYKLHLLLRPRHKLIERKNYTLAPGPLQAELPVPGSDLEQNIAALHGSVVAAHSSQPRQERLLHLTTQLLWRLQQSSPLHSAAQSPPGISVLTAKPGDKSGRFRPSTAAPGLEQSQGALYEIGVSDDGVLEGLAEAEMRESLLTLQSMAASLGCHVVIRRLVAVGEGEICQDVGRDGVNPPPAPVQVLWIVEAFVTPGYISYDPSEHSSLKLLHLQNPGEDSSKPHIAFSGASYGLNKVEQLRLSLTGGTTSGKSSLLGTLSTSTLDNGRGKSRLSLLKHRHEISSGLTSSIVTEIVGYSGNHDTVLNCALDDIQSWGDIHAACGTGRIVAISDTAGHPRYRRTTVRGLISLKPHWTICCIAADSAVMSIEQIHKMSPMIGVSSPIRPEFGHFEAHLELCLTLELPLVVVITKMDAASRTSLHSTLDSITTYLKKRQRQPVVLQRLSQGFSESGSPQILTLHDMTEAKRVLTSGSSSPRTLVPIILTSAVTGRGIGTLHALLRQLPILRSDDTGSPPRTGATSSLGRTVFNIDEVFGASNADAITLHDGRRTLEGYIICGHLSEGPLLVGDELALGPFSATSITKASRQDGHSETLYPRTSVDTYQNGARISSRTEVSEDPDGAHHTPVWCMVRVVSIRDLRQPVQRLEADHCGTAGVVLTDPSLHTVISKIRKGMVMTSIVQHASRHEPPAYRRFRACFTAQRASGLAVGGLVTVYTSSIRALATVISIESSDKIQRSDHLVPLENATFSDRKPLCLQDGLIADYVHAHFHFVNGREFFRENDRVLIMPDKVNVDVIGLGGIMGRIINPMQ